MTRVAPAVTIDPELKRKCPRTALGCVTARVVAGDSPEALAAELRAREEEILRLPDPRAVLKRRRFWRRAPRTKRSAKTPRATAARPRPSFGG